MRDPLDDDCSDASATLPGIDLGGGPTGRSADAAAPVASADPEPVTSASPRFELHRGDAVEWLSSLADASVDLIVTDPAYESLEKHRAVGTTTRLKHSKASSNDWFQIFPNERFPELFREAYRVLRKNRHFYLFCDQETMFVAKPLAEQAGFRFWKPIVWDKCLAPETPVWSSRGVVPLGEIRIGDEVATPRGTFARVEARRTVRAESVRIALSDGTTVIAANDHRFIRVSGEEVTAGDLAQGDRLAMGTVGTGRESELRLDQLIPEDKAVYETRDPRSCLWCGQEFQNVRAAAAHQARFCTAARSKESMAHELGVSPKRLRRWMTSGQLPASWARQLGLNDQLTRRVRLYLQNDAGSWYPESIPLDHRWGKLVGLFAAEGNFANVGISLALHVHEKHLVNHVARLARSVGAKATVWPKTAGHGVVVNVNYGIISLIIQQFVGGTNAVTKHMLPLVYRATREFRRGVFDGLIEGDGHWSHDEQRETLNVASLDLAMFAHRHVLEQGLKPTVRRFENDHSGGYRVRFDPGQSSDGIRVVSVEPAGHLELVDISIDDPDELYLLGNGLVTHNCKIGMGYHYRSRYELVLFFEKGKRKLNDLGQADIIAHPRIHRGYPAEKPPEVSEVLIRQSTDEGMLVVDPFCGSGSVGVAAGRLGRLFLGTDVCHEAIEVSTGRIEAAGLTRDPALHSRARGGR